MTRWAKQLLVLVAIAAGIGFLLLQQPGAERSVVTVGNRAFVVSVVRTAADIQKGLSGTDKLSDGHGMLFIFPRTDDWNIWMKDMNYSIDVVWLDEDGVVTYMVKDMQPSSYPKKYGPEVPSRYVIELPSGTIDKTRITVGDSIVLPSGI